MGEALGTPAGWMVEGGSRGGAMEQPPGVAGGDIKACC